MFIRLPSSTSRVAQVRVLTLDQNEQDEKRLARVYFDWHNQNRRPAPGEEFPLKDISKEFPQNKQILVQVVTRAATYYYFMTYEIFMRLLTADPTRVISHKHWRREMEHLKVPELRFHGVVNFRVVNGKILGDDGECYLHIPVNDINIFLRSDA